MKKLSLLSVLLLLCIFSFGQNNSTIVFDETTYDFGEILAGSGPAKHVFTFTNNGDEPIVVSNAKASCGCTVPKWTKEPVMPGQTGTIEVTYTTTKSASPKPFTKSITVTSNGKPATLALLIKGHVVAELSSFSNGVLNKKEIVLNKSKKKTISESFEITNNGNTNLNIKDITKPDYITVTPSANVITPGNKVTVNITVKTKGLEQINEPIIIDTDSAKTPKLTVQIKYQK